MRKLFFIFSLLTVFRSNSQVYFAGTIYPYYFDINPDTLLSYYYTGPTHLNLESFYIDVNNDLQNDLRLTVRAVSSSGGGEGYFTITSLNSNTYKRFSHLDVSTNRKVAFPLSVSDSINSQISIWDTTTLYLTYSSYYMSTHLNIPDWLTNNDLYTGIKYIDPTDTIYGWIRISCNRIATNVNCLVKDFSFQSASIEIKEYTKEKVKIYPNPVSQILHLKIEGIEFNSEIEITNYLGQTILKTEFKNQIDVSTFPIGFYFLQLHTKEGVLTRKIVIQH